MAGHCGAVRADRWPLGTAKPATARAVGQPVVGPSARPWLEDYLLAAAVITDCWPFGAATYVGLA